MRVPLRENIIYWISHNIILQKYKLVIAGDLNERVGKRENVKPVGMFGEHILNDNGKDW